MNLPIQPLGPATSTPALRPLPMLGMHAACGFPSPAEDFMDEDLDLATLCISNPVATFFARAEGRSMRAFGIDDGDLLIIDRSVNARDGDIALVLWDGGLTVKQLRMRRGSVQLQSGDGAPPVIVGEGVEVQVWGVVMWSFRKQLRR